ncbi:Long-chain-alcohol dehydrogenase 1 [bioreactor metagenome]|uniref:Long-chain-alcohol dehydrogenase 1 n=1 Tax=bioreactor metagenome TaxID=1076179 RepID=A0A644XCP5_9ZZZZ
MWEDIKFVTPDVVFGMDTVRCVGDKIKALNGKRVLIITGPSVKSSGALDKVLESVKNAGIDFDVNVQNRTTSEPTTDLAEEAAKYIVDGNFDVIVGVGGGSILDVAKMSSALTTNPGKTRDYFGPGKVKHKGRPTVMIPTTAGTGSEVTKHAIFLDQENNVKKAVASAALLPDVAIVDPVLTVSSPRNVTSASGFDAWLHAAEPFVSKNANPITDALSLKAVSVITKYLGTAWSDPNDLDARYHMSLGSLMAGMVLNNAGTSLVHALAYPIGGEYHATHGISLSVLLVPCFKAIAASKGDRLVQLAKAMGENVDGLSTREGVEVALDAMAAFMKSVDLPISLEEIGVTDRSAVERWATAGWNERRLLGRCARDLTVEDIASIYKDSFDARM